MRRARIVTIAVAGLLLASGIVALGETSFSVMTWNIQGYPESTAVHRTWFTQSLEEYEPTILCIQEIDDSGNVDIFIATEYVEAGAFTDSSSERDNAIFCDSSVTLWNVPDPDGFLHPAQLSVFLIDGIPYYVLTIQLDGADFAQRAKERELLEAVVDGMLASSHHVILAGDFHTTGLAGDRIEDLAANLGLVWLEPDNYCCVGTTYTEERYDHILVSQAIVEAWAITTTIIEFDDLASAKHASDHRPVLAVFSPIQPERPRPPVTTNRVPEDEPEEPE